MNNKISIILPVYNEEESIGQVIDDVFAVMSGTDYDFEIIVVDDASADRSAEIARTKKIRLLQHIHNKGVGAARKTGILNCQGGIIVMLDSDNTYPAKSIPEALKFIPQYDQVIGIRDRERGTLRILRRPVKWLMFRLASFLAKQHIPDLNSGFRVLKKEIILKYLYLIPDGFSCVSTMTLIFLCNGYDIKYIPIEYYQRKGKSKFRIVNDTRDFLFTIIRIIMYFNPLRIFIPLSLILLGTGIIKVLFDVYIASIHNMQESDIVIIVSAINILTFGLLADLIVTIHKKE